MSKDLIDYNELTFEELTDTTKSDGDWYDGILPFLGLAKKDSTENETLSMDYGLASQLNPENIKLMNMLKSGNNKRRYGEPDWVDKFNMGGNILGGLGDLASGWAALQNVGIARDSQKFKENAWQQNMARQKTTVNNPIRAQQALLKSDFYNDPARANSLKLVT